MRLMLRLSGIKRKPISFSFFLIFFHYQSLLHKSLIQDAMGIIMNANLSFIQIFNTKSRNPFTSNVNVSFLQSTIMSQIDDLLTPDIEPNGSFSIKIYFISYSKMSGNIKILFTE